MSDGINWTIVFTAAAVSAGVGCLVAAAVLWWKGVKAKYDPVFAVTTYVDDGSVAEVEFNEAALRRMMKETSKEMDWTKVRWG